jgi:hypothetical protein
VHRCTMVAFRLAAWSNAPLTERTEVSGEAVTVDGYAPVRPVAPVRWWGARCADGTIMSRPQRGRRHG